MSLWLRQGFLTSISAYNRRYELTKPLASCKAKVVDDTLLYDTNIEDAFFHVWNYLTLCTKNGIAITEPKFQFCRDSSVQFC